METDIRTKEKKKWVHRPPKTTEADIDTGKLACGCECPSCFTAYKTAVEQKALIEELKKALKEEKLAVNEAIKVVEEVEKEKTVDIFELKTEIKRLKDQMAAMEHSTEVDAKYRLGEKYKQEEVLLENTTYKEENNVLRGAAMQLQADLEAVLKENEEEKQKNTMHEHKNELLVAKMKQYENKIYEYEMLNNDLRVKLSQQFELAYTSGAGGAARRRNSVLTNAQRQYPDPSVTANFSSMYPLQPTAIQPRGGRSSGTAGSGLSGLGSSSVRTDTGRSGSLQHVGGAMSRGDSLSALMQSQW